LEVPRFGEILAFAELRIALYGLLQFLVKDLFDVFVPDGPSWG